MNSKMDDIEVANEATDKNSEQQDKQQFGKLRNSMRLLSKKIKSASNLPPKLTYSVTETNKSKRDSFIKDNIFSIPDGNKRKSMSPIKDNVFSFPEGKRRYSISPIKLNPTTSIKNKIKSISPIKLNQSWSPKSDVDISPMFDFNESNSNKHRSVRAKIGRKSKNNRGIYITIDMLSEETIGIKVETERNRLDDVVIPFETKNEYSYFKIPKPSFTYPTCLFLPYNERELSSKKYDYYLDSTPEYETDKSTSESTFDSSFPNISSSSSSNAMNDQLNQIDESYYMSPSDTKIPAFTLSPCPRSLKTKESRTCSDSQTNSGNLEIAYSVKLKKPTTGFLNKFEKQNPTGLDGGVTNRLDSRLTKNTVLGNVRIVKAHVPVFTASSKKLPTRQIGGIPIRRYNSMNQEKSIENFGKNKERSSAHSSAAESKTNFKNRNLSPISEVDETNTLDRTSAKSMLKCLYDGEPNEMERKKSLCKLQQQSCILDENHNTDFQSKFSDTKGKDFYDSKTAELSSSMGVENKDKSLLNTETRLGKNTMLKNEAIPEYHVNKHSPVSTKYSLSKDSDSLWNNNNQSQITDNVKDLSKFYNTKIVKSPRVKIYNCKAQNPILQKSDVSNNEPPLAQSSCNNGDIQKSNQSIQPDYCKNIGVDVIQEHQNQRRFSNHENTLQVNDQMLSVTHSEHQQKITYNEERNLLFPSRGNNLNDDPEGKEILENLSLLRLDGD